MQKRKTVFILNICIVILEIIAIGWMMSGLSRGPLSAAKWLMLRYFTVDSNILLGIAALIAAIDGRKVLNGMKPAVSDGTLILKLAATASVGLTMIITIFFLAPMTGTLQGALSLFAYSNFLLHLLNPLLAIITFVCFEKTDRIAFRHTFTGVIPMLLYAVYYVGTTLAHTENGVIAKGYDWYGFFFLGVNSAVIVVPIITLLTWGISCALHRLNRRGV